MTTDPTPGLRDEIAEALMRWAEGNSSPKYASMRRPSVVRQNAYARADAVLDVINRRMPAVVPVSSPPADRAAVRCSSCEHEARYHDVDGRCWFTVEQGVPERDAVCSCLLRRMADETPTAPSSAAVYADAAASADRVAARLRAEGHDQRAQGAADVADVLRAAVRIGSREQSAPTPPPA